MTDQHSPEPWTFNGSVVDDNGSEHVVVIDANGEDVFGEYGLATTDDIPRIVACVNALAGISIEVIKSGMIGPLLKELLEYPIVVEGPEPQTSLLTAFMNSQKQGRPYGTI